MQKIWICMIMQVRNHLLPSWLHPFPNYSDSCVSGLSTGDIHVCVSFLLTSQQQGRCLHIMDIIGGGPHHKKRTWIHTSESPQMVLWPPTQAHSCTVFACDDVLRGQLDVSEVAESRGSNITLKDCQLVDKCWTCSKQSLLQLVFRDWARWGVREF